MEFNAFVQMEWVGVMLITSPIWATFIWYLWQLSIKPRLIPRDKIKRMAEELEALYGNDAEDAAFTEEDSAWRRSETFQQGVWHQVRLELYRRRK